MNFGLVGKRSIYLAYNKDKSRLYRGEICVKMMLSLLRVMMTFPATSGSLTHQIADGHVCTVKLAIAHSTLDNKGRRTKPLKVLERPVEKLVLLQEASET